MLSPSSSIVALSAVLALLGLVEPLRDLFSYHIQLILVHFLTVHDVSKLVINILELDLGALLLRLQQFIPQSHA